MQKYRLLQMRHPHLQHSVEQVEHTKYTDTEKELLVVIQHLSMLFVEISITQWLLGETLLLRV